MAHIETVLAAALAQDGDRYVFGAEASATDPDPKAFDCSELVEWACARAGVTMVDGAYNQWAFCRGQGTEIPVNLALGTRGALLFRGPGRGTGRNFIDHVAISLGNGTTIEARGSKWGVGSFPSAGRGWGWAAEIPGVDYTPLQPIPHFTEDDTMYMAIVADAGDQTWWVTDQVTKRALADGNELKFLATYCGLKTNNGAPMSWPRTWVDAIPVA